MYNILWLLVILSIAAVFDVKKHRIPNLIIIAGCIIGAMIRGPAFAGYILVTTLFLFPLFFLRMVGAGDIKLMALICGYMGFLNGIYIIGLGFFIAALRIIISFKFQNNLISRFSYFFAYIGQIIRTGEINEYYNSKRDGYENTIPLALFLLLGAAIYAAVK